MAVIDELIREEENGSLSFGNYDLTERPRRMDLNITETVIR